VWRCIRRWLASLLVVGALVLPVSAQEQPPGQEKSDDRAPPALAYALLFGATLLVLVIVCMPSRKR
jgi:hypothetical protein